MNRLTRLFSPHSTLLVAGRHRLSSTVRSITGKSPPYARRREFSISTLSRRKMDPVSHTMDSNAPDNLSGSVIEGDFVNVKSPGDLTSSISDPNPNPNFGDLEGSGRFEDGIGEGISGLENEERESEDLPEELSRNMVVLNCENAEGGTCNVYLVGTAHVSQESCREVEAVISFIKPEVVFLELCSSRVAILTLKDLKIPTMSEMIDMWKKKQNLFGILYSWFLAKVADKLEVLPGSEFRVAFEEAMKCGSKVILGDRPVQVTLRRTWGKMPVWHKTKLLYSFIFQAFFLPSPDDLNRMLKEMDDVDMLTLVIQEMSKEFPTLMETLVNERDQYMSSTLHRVASEHSSVVAVVGKGHLQGMKKHWMQPVELNELLEIPSKAPAFSAVKILTSVGIAAAGVAIISGIYLTAKKQS